MQLHKGATSTGRALCDAARTNCNPDPYNDLTPPHFDYWPVRMTGLRRAAIFEAWTLILLFGVAMPLKYWAGIAQATSVMGPIHGLMFMVFVWFVIRSWAEGIIDIFGTLRLLIGASIPGAGFINERWLRSQYEEGERDAL
ncbi:hypothetical protein RCCS2_02950 [Roseobacter sp. CCS2]|nr:hypothetical protein RCCS2_02950 [Roseobacter sp. CCS2]